MFVRVTPFATVFAAMGDAYYGHVTVEKRISFRQPCSLFWVRDGVGFHDCYHQHRFVSRERGYRDRQTERRNAIATATNARAMRCAAGGAFGGLMNLCHGVGAMVVQKPIESEQVLDNERGAFECGRVNAMDIGVHECSK